MPRKLKNGKYKFKRGCIGETDDKGNFVIVKTVRRKKPQKKKNKQDTEKVDKVDKVDKVKITQKKRRSEKKQFKKIPQTGGEQSNLDINVHMLREFYLKNF